MNTGKAFAAVTTVAAVGLVTLAGSGTVASSAERARSAHLGAVLVGGNEVPNAGDPDGYGFADVKVRRGQVCWHITVNAVEPIAAAHIHAGPAGVPGPVVVPLNPYEAGCTDASKRTTRFIRQHPGQFYVNVHNADFPGGALRGQLAR